MEMLSISIGSLFMELDHERKSRVILERQLNGLISQVIASAVFCIYY